MNNLFDLVALFIGDYDQLQNLSFIIPFQDRNVLKLVVKKRPFLLGKYAKQLIFLDCSDSDLKNPTTPTQGERIRLF
jgi:hypothetical protein